MWRSKNSWNIFINLYIVDNRNTDIHVTVFWHVISYTLVDTSVSVVSHLHLQGWYFEYWGSSFLRNLRYLPGKQHCHGTGYKVSHLRTEATVYSETLLPVYRTIGHHIPQGSNLHSHGYQNLIVYIRLKSYLCLYTIDSNTDLHPEPF